VTQERDSGWVEIGRWTWADPVRLAVTPALLAAMWLIAQVVHVGFRALRDDRDTGDLGAELALAAGIAVVAAVVSVIVQRRRFPRVCVDLATDRIRIGRRELPLRDLIWARLDARPYVASRRRTLHLRISAGLHPQALFDLTATGRRALTAQDRALLVEVLERSDVDVPKTRDDPTGRFARYNFPNNVSKADAIALVVDTPGPGDPLPVPDPRNTIGRA
jgi:hypothetical protein